MSARRPQRGRRSAAAPWNRVVGAVVPALLLAYVLFAYRLVVLQYAYRFLHLDGALTQSSWIPAAGWLITIHALLVATALQYLRVFRGPAPLPASISSHPPPAIQQRRIIFECDEKGDPLHCWRDACQGRWKPPRTRHCGTCRTCRPGFDHHCVWFNACIVAPGTIQPFLLTTLLAPALLVIALSPLGPIAWRHLHMLWTFARSSPDVDRVWWSTPWTWIGGPWTRYGWALVIASWIYPSNAAPAYLTSAAWIAKPNLGVILLIFWGASIAAICLGLFTVTFLNLRRADLTIDTERRKFARRAAQPSPSPSSSQPPGGGDTRSAPPTSTLPAGTSFFWVPLSSGTPRPSATTPASDSAAAAAASSHGAVVPCAPGEQPYASPDAMRNLRVMLGLGSFQDSDWLTSWPMSKAWREELERRALAIRADSGPS